MEGILNTIGWPVLAMIATWFVASKIGKAKYTALAEQAQDLEDAVADAMRAKAGELTGCAQSALN